MLPPGSISDVGLGLTGCKISNIGEDIKNGHYRQGNDAIDLDLANRVLWYHVRAGSIPTCKSSANTNLDFIDNVEGILISSIGKYDLVKRIRQTISSGLPVKGIMEVECRLLNGGMASENHEAGKRNEEERGNLDDTDAIGEVVRELGVQSNDWLCERETLERRQ